MNSNKKHITRCRVKPNLYFIEKSIKINKNKILSVTSTLGIFQEVEIKPFKEKIIVNILANFLVLEQVLDDSWEEKKVEMVWRRLWRSGIG